MNRYDVIVIGAGSIGTPTAMALGELGLRTLVIDKRPSPGQGENKHAIGGVRATHTDPAKIIAGHRSLEIFSTWRDRYGDDIEWSRGGYIFPVYRPQEADLLKSFLPVQKQFKLKIDFVDAQSIADAVPGINRIDLMGGTISPDDGTASPLLAVNAFFRRAVDDGVVFQFRKTVTQLLVEQGRIVGAATETDRFCAPVVVDAAGPFSDELAQSIGERTPVVPESHEAAVTEPVQLFCPAMVVDLRPGPGSSNFYFYQNDHGQLVFCITPDPPIVGRDYRETSTFLPQVCQRLVTLVPRLKNLRVRRVWRGLYPMTSDGSPFVGWNRHIKGLMHATGMCGQGFMLGPGLGETIARAVAGQSTADDAEILNRFSLYRDLGSEVEALK